MHLLDRIIVYRQHCVYLLHRIIVYRQHLPVHLLHRIIVYRQHCVCTYCTECLCEYCAKWQKIPSYNFNNNTKLRAIIQKSRFYIFKCF